MNNKLFVIAGTAALVVLAVARRRLRPSAPIRERMRERRDAMRRRSPRGRMLASIEAIKADTEEILTLLRAQRAEHPEC